MFKIKAVIASLIVFSAISSAQVFAANPGKNFTIEITNKTQGLKNSAYLLLPNGVTSCTPDEGNSLPSQLNVTCNDPIPEAGDNIYIYFEQGGDGYDNFAWNYEINLDNVDDGQKVLCYIVGTEGRVGIRCTAATK